MDRQTIDILRKLELKLHIEGDDVNSFALVQAIMALEGLASPAHTESAAPLTREDVERQYRDGIHVASGLPRATCPCGFCAKHRFGFNSGDGVAIPAIAPSPVSGADERATFGESPSHAEFDTAIATLRHLIDCLRKTGTYSDEEGEATDYLEPLLQAKFAALAPIPTGQQAHVTDDEFWNRRPAFDTKGVPRVTLRDLVHEHYQHYFAADKAREIAERHIEDMSNATAAPANKS